MFHFFPWHSTYETKATFHSSVLYVYIAVDKILPIFSLSFAYPLHEGSAPFNCVVAIVLQHWMQMEWQSLILSEQKDISNAESFTC